MYKRFSYSLLDIQRRSNWQFYVARHDTKINTYLTFFPKKSTQKHLIIKGGDVIASVIWQATLQ